MRAIGLALGGKEQRTDVISLLPGDPAASPT
jgi:hypothetical protein